MRYIYPDIETLPSANPALADRIRANVKPPGQYKKPESIAEWMAANAESAVAEELGKTALDGLYGSVCVISWAIDDGPIFTGMVTDELDEAAMLRAQFDAIDNASSDTVSNTSMPLIVVGHNVEFDLRFLFQRCARYGIRIPQAIRRAFDARPDYIDTMRMWAGYKGYVKLKELAHELLGDAGDDIDGSDVARVWAASPQTVAEHCRRDVERVRQLHAKFRAV
jgi:hypothetical protein